MSKPAALVQRHTRSASSEGPGPSAAQRRRHHASAQATVRRRAAGQRRLVVPRAAQAGTGGLDHGGMEACRQRPSDEVLLPDPPGPQEAASRERELASAGGRHHARREAEAGLSGQCVSNTGCTRFRFGCVRSFGAGEWNRSWTRSCGITSRKPSWSAQTRA